MRAGPRLPSEPETCLWLPLPRGTQQQHPPVTYALTVAEAEVVIDTIGWTATSSWIDKGGYGTTRPSRKLMGLLSEHEMSPKAWWSKVAGQEP